MENKENLILLTMFPLTKCGMVNDFLHSKGLEKSFDIVQAEITFKSQREDVYERMGTCLALKPVDEKTAFIYNIKGREKLIREIEEFQRQHPFNKGLS